MRGWLRSIIREEILKRAEVITALATKNGELPILSGSPRLLKDIASFLKARSDVASVAFYDSGMNELIHDGLRPRRPPPRLAPNTAVSLSEEDDAFVFVAPIFALRIAEDVDILHDGEREATVRKHIGWVRLEFSKSSMRDAERRILERGVLLLLLSTAASGVVVYVLVSMATRPLTRIVQAANAIASGDFSQGPGKHRHDEIGTLANAFQRMKITIQQVLHEMDRLVRAIKEGRLEIRGQAELFSGEWRKLVTGVNLLTDAFEKAALELQEARGSLERRVEQRTAELAQANREMLRLYREAQRADQLKSEFIAVLSHELRNPLAPIRTGLQLLRRSPPGSPMAARAWEIMQRQTEHLTRLVDDLLDVTRISRGKIDLCRARVDLRDVVRASCDDLRSLFEPGRLDLRLELPPGPIWVDADATRVAQVVGNLLQNAAKFTPAGGIVAVTVAAGGGRAEISVRDTGVGIEPGEVERMFEPFAQAEQGLARTQGGLGLGLPLAKGLVELHGGSIRARSEGHGRGSEFVVSLPLAA